MQINTTGVNLLSAFHKEGSLCDEITSVVSSWFSVLSWFRWPLATDH